MSLEGEGVTQYLVHLGYALMLCALLARDILLLRIILIFAQGNLAAYAYYNNLHSISFWNWAFVVINTIWVFRIIRERRSMEVPAELKPIYEKHFAALTSSEFLRVWSWAERRTGRDSQLVAEGQYPDALYFLLSGTVAVCQGKRQIALLQPGTFIAEMSLLTGKLTTADVIARGEIEYMVWPTQRLRRVSKNNPMLWTKIQSVIGCDLVEKIRQSSLSAAEREAINTA